MMEMRLLLVLEETKCGGAEVSFFALCRALAARYRVDVALSRSSLDNPTIRRLCEALGDTPAVVHSCANRLNPGTFSNLHGRLRRAAARELAALIDGLRPDLVIVNLPTVERGQTVVDAAELCPHRPPVWGFLHLTQPPSLIGAKLGAIRNLLVPRLIRRFDRLFTVSQSGAREISSRYRIQVPDVVYPPTETFPPLALPMIGRPQLRHAQGLPDKFLVGIVGRVQIYHKGHDVALRVIRQLLDQGKMVHLVVVGDGPDRQRVQRMADRLGIDRAVSFLGWRNDLDVVMPLLDAILMPSRYEGFPLVAVQAAVTHVPVIAYAVGGLAELIPADFTAPYGQESGLTAAVAALSRNPQLWPADEVARRALDCCEPSRAADRVSVLLAEISSPRFKTGSAVASP
jgi:glycosyltransferase involved in cell wall biosynthesis